MSRQFRDRNGQLTGYAFVCGYVEVRSWLTISRQHQVYHVKGFDPFDGHHWEVARTLPEIRRVAKKLLGRMNVLTEDLEKASSITLDRRMDSSLHGMKVRFVKRVGNQIEVELLDTKGLYRKGETFIASPYDLVISKN